MQNPKNMAKKRQELGDDLSVNLPKLKKKALPIHAEEIVKKVHQIEPVVIKKEKVPVKHLNISFPMDIYKQLKSVAVDEDTTFKQMVIEYVCQGLGVESPPRKDRRGNLKR